MDHLPTEITDLIFDNLLPIIGVYRAIRLRTTCRLFDDAVLRVVFDREVVSLDHDSTPELLWSLPSHLRGRALCSRSNFTSLRMKVYAATAARLSTVMGRLMGDTSEGSCETRRRQLASALNEPMISEYDDSMDAQHLLCGACVIGDLDLAKALLNRQLMGHQIINLELTTAFFETPLILAARNGHLAIVQHLLAYGARPGTTSHMRSYSIYKGWLDTPTHLYKQWLLLGSTIPTAMRAAVCAGHIPVVSLLLQPDHRLPLSSPEYLSAVRQAVDMGRMDLVELLLSTINRKITDFESFREMLLWAAVLKSNKTMVEMMLDAGADIDFFLDSTTDKQGALYFAASLGDIAMVRLLLDRGAQVHIQLGDMHHHAIDGAALRGHLEIVELLLDHGADAARVAQCAAVGGQCRLLRYIVQRCPEVLSKQVSPSGASVGSHALFSAVMSRNLSNISILADAGVDLDAGINDDERKETVPINWARACGAASVVNHLYALGAELGYAYWDAHAYPYTIRGLYRPTDETWQWLEK